MGEGRQLAWSFCSIKKARLGLKEKSKDCQPEIREVISETAEGLAHNWELQPTKVLICDWHILRSFLFNSVRINANSILYKSFVSLLHLCRTLIKHVPGLLLVICIDKCDSYNLFIKQRQSFSAFSAFLNSLYAKQCEFGENFNMI